MVTKETIPEGRLDKEYSAFTTLVGIPQALKVPTSLRHLWQAPHGDCIKLKKGPPSKDLAWRCLHCSNDYKHKLSKINMGKDHIKNVLKHLRDQHGVNEQGQMVNPLVQSFFHTTPSHGTVELNAKELDTHKNFTPQMLYDILPFMSIQYPKMTLPQLLALTLNELRLNTARADGEIEPRGKIYWLDNRNDPTTPDLIYSSEIWPQLDCFDFLDSKTHEKIGLCGFETRPPSSLFVLPIYLRPAAKLYECDQAVTGKDSYKAELRRWCTDRAFGGGNPEQRLWKFNPREPEQKLKVGHRYDAFPAVTQEKKWMRERLALIRARNNVAAYVGSDIKKSSTYKIPKSDSFKHSGVIFFRRLDGSAIYVSTLRDWEQDQSCSVVEEGIRTKTYSMPPADVSLERMKIDHLQQCFSFFETSSAEYRSRYDIYTSRESEFKAGSIMPYDDSGFTNHSKYGNDTGVIGAPHAADDSHVSNAADSAEESGSESVTSSADEPESEDDSVSVDYDALDNE